VRTRALAQRSTRQTWRLATSPALTRPTQGRHLGVNVRPKSSERQREYVLPRPGKPCQYERVPLPFAAIVPLCRRPVALP
jgi:hypothetical protein